MRVETSNQVAFLTAALAAKPERREALWRSVKRGDGSDGAELQAALVQSLPEHSGFDPITARRRLQLLAAREPADDITAVARLRLAEMKIDTACSDEQAQLRLRLNRVVDIEREMDQHSAPKEP